ncbi:MAG: hypothetical protein FJX75_02640 [Armatimonadetes bacterium]|nr:hypothetical protein [Armatimonadota bacterium]
MRTLTRIFRHNWHLKATAVGLAILLWAVVLLRTNPWTAREFEATVEVRGVPEGLQVMSVTPAKVKVTLAGRRRTVDRVADQTLRAYAGVSRRDVGEHQVAVIVDPGALPRGVEILSPSTHQVTVALDRTDQQTRAVLAEFRGRTAPGFAALPGRPHPNEVTIRGPRSLVQAVASVVAVIDYSGIQTTRTFTSRLEARDARGMPQAGIEIEPPTAEVKVVVEPINVKTVPVHLEISFPAGYQAASVDVYPPIVAITGKPDTLRPIEFVRTRAVRATQDGTLPNVDLELPAGVSVVGDQPSVRVTVQLQPIPLSRARPAPAARREPPPEPGGDGAPKAPTSHPPAGTGEPDSGQPSAPPGPPGEDTGEGDKSGNG